MARPIAFVTGSSRGIGKAIAIALARAGHDVVVSARTVHPGEVRDNSLTVHRSDTRVLPGSLDETAAAIEAAGGRALRVPMDLTDRASVEAGARQVLDEWGGADVLVHNGRHIGPGLMDLFLDTPVDALSEVRGGPLHRADRPHQGAAARHARAGRGPGADDHLERRL